MYSTSILIIAYLYGAVLKIAYVIMTVPNKCVSKSNQFRLNGSSVADEQKFIISGSYGQLEKSQTQFSKLKVPQWIHLPEK